MTVSIDATERAREFAVFLKRHQGVDLDAAALSTLANEFAHVRREAEEYSTLQERQRCSMWLSEQIRSRR